MTTIDPTLRAHTDDALARPLHPQLADARADILAAARDLLALRDEDLTKPWGWIGGSEEEARYGAYRAAEALEQGEHEARALTASTDADDTLAARIIAPATAARWDLHGLLLPLHDEDLDADPGSGEWTIRLTLGHTITSQIAYGWGTSWWIRNPHDVADPDLPTSLPESFWEPLEDESTSAGTGGVDSVRSLLDDALDATTERLAGIPDGVLGQAARWSGFPVTVGFRLGRWGSHIREHVIQVEKTLAMLGRVPNEQARLARHVLAHYGRTEQVVFGRAVPPAVVDRVRQAAAEARRATADARAAAAAAPAGATPA